MKASVVMATLNGEAYLQHQLDSLAKQVMVPDELIVADDGSIDRTTEIVEKFALSAPFPTTLLKRPQRFGYAKNFADAALRASGDIILFCDQDDCWKPTKISRVKEYFNNNPRIELVIHNITVCNEALYPLIPDYFAHFTRSWYNRFFFIKGCATAFRRSLSSYAFPLPPEGRWTHDGRIHALAHMSNSHGFIEETLIQHRLHSSNASGYVINTRSQAGLLLAKLAWHALQSIPRSYRAVLHFPPPPISECEVVEFLKAYRQFAPPNAGEPDAHKILHLIQCINDRARIQEAHSKRSKAFGILWHLFQGKYKYNGSGYAFAVDILRLLKHST